MNMLKKKIIPVFIVVLLGLSIFPSNINSVGVGSSDVTSFKDTLIISAKDYTTAGYDFDKIADPIFYERHVLCEGHLPLVLDIETTKEFSLTDKDKTDFLKSSEIGKTNIGKINYKYNILIKEDYSYIVKHYKWNNETVNEYSKINETWNNYTIPKKVIDYNETVNTYRYVWKDIKYLEKIDFKTTNKIIVDIIGTFKADLVHQEIDIIPDIKIGDYTNSLDKYAWWSSSWNYKKKITIDNTKVSGSSNLIDFPILVKIDADSDIGAECQADLDDIAFTNSAEDTQLKHEIESYSFAGDDLTAYIWVKIPILDYNDDTEIYIYYGNAEVANQEHVTDTWNTNYMMVQHMKDSTTSTVLDSTVNDNDGNKEGANEPIETTGKIDKGQDFDGSNDYVDAGDDSSVNMGSGDFTVSLWFKRGAISSTEGLLIKGGTNAGGKRIWLAMLATGTININIDDNSLEGEIRTSTEYDDDAWHQATMVRDGNNFYLYMDGNYVDSDDISGVGDLDQAVNLFIGCSFNHEISARASYFNGVIDEVRISATSRTDGWIVTTYNTINSPSTFLSFAGEEELPVNTPPNFNVPIPINGSTGQDRPPVVNIIVNDTEGDTFNLTWYSNSSGSWLVFGYNHSVTNGTFYQTNNNFSTSNTVYYWNVSAIDDGEINNSNNSGVYHFTTKEGAQAPASFSAPEVAGVSPTDTIINLTWTQGINSTHTRIQRKTGSSPTSITDGTNIYNDTGESTNDTGLNPGTRYFYTAFAWNSTLNEWATGNATVDQYTYPGLPTAFIVTTINTTKITLTWTTGTGAEYTNISYKTTGYPVNYEDGTSAYAGALETKDVTDLSPGTTYYFRAWGYDTASYFISLTNASGSNMTSWVPSNATDFYVNVSTSNNLDISWVNGNGTNTIIRYSTVNYPTGTSGGTLLLNDTTGLTTYQHTGLNYSTKYYYRVWSWISPATFSTGNYSAANWTRPQIPQNATGTLYSTKLNITWDNATGGDMVILLKKSGSYPTNITDGTELCNYSTHTRYYNLTHTSGDYYALWSYNNSTYLYSALHELLWGGLQVNVYDENTSAALTWDIFITNAAGSETKEYTGLTNPASLDINVIPNGDNTALILSAASHRSRTYYMDLEVNNQYTVNAYLPKTNESELYLITVNNDYDIPVEDAKITFKRSIGGSYTNVSTMLTDANGQVDLYLMHDILYKVEISKTGYDTTYSDYTPSSSIFVHTFKIYFTEGTYANATGCNEVITFQGVVQGGNLTLWYNDTAGLTDNTQIYVYEYNYSDLSTNLIFSVSNTSNNTIALTISVNSTNPHYVYLFYNHSTCGYQKLTLFFSGKYGASDDGGITNETKFNAIFDNYGVNPFGWSNTIVFIVLVGVLFSLGQRNSGVALIASGVIGLFFMFILFGGMTDLRDSIPILFIILGIIVQWRNNQREGGL